MPTPAELDAARQQRMDRARALLDSSVGAAPDARVRKLTAPAVPQQQEPELALARNKYLDAAQARIAPQVGPGPAAVDARTMLDDLEDRPDAVLAEPSLLEQFVLAFTPHVIREDNRPATMAEHGKAVAADLMATMGTGALASPTGHRLVEKVTGVRPLTGGETFFGWEGQDRPDLTLDPDAWGLKSENEALYLMRVFGSTIPALVQETAERIPLPGGTLGEYVLGVDPAQRGQRIHRDNGITDWAQAVLEKIERGEGFEQDLQASFKERLGEDWANTGWWLGLAIDTLTDWEGLAARGPKAVAAVGERAAMLRKFLPADYASKWDAIVHALRTSEGEAGEAIGRKLADGVVRNGTPLPPEIELRADSIALSEHGQTFRELMDGDGVDTSKMAARTDQAFLDERKAVEDAARQAHVAGDVDVPAPLPEDAPVGFRAGGAEHTVLDGGATRGPGGSKPSERTVYVAPADAAAIRQHRVQRHAAVFVTDDGRLLLARQRRGKWLITKANVRPGQAEDLVGIRYRTTPEVGLSPVELRDGAEYRPGTRQFGDFAAGPKIDELLKLNEAAPELATAVRQARRRGRAGDSSRPPPPAALIPPKSMLEFWQQLKTAYTTYGTAFSLPRHLGFERLRHLDPKQSIESATYGLRNANGDLVRTGRFDDLVDLLLDRGLDGDEVWFRDQRPAARWRKTDKPILGSDYHFSSPEERALILLKRSKDPRAIPAKLRRIGIAPAPDVPGVTPRVIGSVLLDLVSDAPSRSVLPPPRTRTERVIEEATRLAVRDRIGSSKFRVLPTGAAVPAGDHARIVRDTGTVMKGLGLAELPVGALSEAQEKVVAEIARRFRRDLGPRAPGTLNPGQYTMLRNAVMAEVGGSLADARNRLRGLPHWADRAQEVLATLHTDRRQLGRGGEAARRWLSGVTAAVFGDRLAGVPTHVREVLDRLNNGVRHVSEELYADVVRELGVDKDLGRALHRILGSAIPLPSSEVELARTVLEGGPRPDAELAALRDQVRSSWRGPREAWLDKDDPVLIFDGLQRWASRTQEETAEHALGWLQAVLATSRGPGARASVQFDALAQVPQELLRKVYDEVFTGGQLEGAVTAEAMTAAGLQARAVNGQDALVAYLLRERTAVKMDEAVRELLDRGIAVLPGDPRRHILTRTLEGTGRSWDQAAGRWRYHATEAAQTWALERLRDWGIDEASGAQVKPTKIARREVLIPEYLRLELERLDRLGLVDSRTVFGSRGLDELLRQWKRWTTHGILLPNPAHFLGQALSVAPTLVTTRGWSGAASSGLSFLRNRWTVGELLRRLGGPNHPLFRPLVPGSAVFRTADGRAFSVEDLEHIARRYGLGESQAKTETAEQLGELLRRTSGEGELDVMNIRATARWWNDLLMAGAGAFDQAARLATFLDELERGGSPDAAARAAKEAMLDFANLTDADSKYGRKIFGFYAYMRKDADAYIRALFRDPARVTSQLRLAHASVTSSGLSDIELGALQPGDLSRLVVYQNDHVVSEDGRPNPLYRMTRLSTAPMGVGEFLGIARMLTLRDPEGLESSVNPAIGTLALATTGTLLGSDWGYDRFSANRIPPYLMHGPMGTLVGKAFGVDAVPLRPTDDPLLADPSATDAFGDGTPAVWAAGGDASLSAAERRAKWTLWQAFRLWMGRPVGTAERVARVAGVEQGRPNVTDAQELWSFLGGLDWKAVPTDDEVLRQSKREREVELERAAGDLAP